jgi:hypothetical protein
MGKHHTIDNAIREYCIMQKSFEDMAIRAANAVTQWRDMLAEDGYTTKQADKILDYYVKHKIVKLDWGVGRYNVKHGAFLTCPVMDKALEHMGELPL